MGAKREPALIKAWALSTQVPAAKRRFCENRDRNGCAPASLLFIRRAKHMPRFFFHVRNSGGDIGHDTEGQELPDLDAAQREAINTNREMLGERLLNGGSPDHRQIEIANATWRGAGGGEGQRGGSGQGWSVAGVQGRRHQIGAQLHWDSATRSQSRRAVDKDPQARHCAPSVAAISQRKFSSPAPERSWREGRASPPGWE